MARHTIVPDVRLITKITAKKKPEKLAVFDFETLNWSDPFACGLMDGDGYKLVERETDESNDSFCDRIVDYILNRFGGYILFAHYGGKFDILFLVRALAKRANIETKYVTTGSSVIAVIIKLKNGKQIKIFDSWRIFQTKLADIGKAVGLPKLDIDYEAMNKSPRWREYLYRDCEILFKAVTDMEKVIVGLGSVLKPTAASTAMETFRRVFLTENIRIEMDGGDWLRAFYCGGRVEVFRIGRQKETFCYDVNSMYPYVMMEYDFPVGMPVEITNRLDYYFEQCTKDGKYVGFFQCSIDLPDSCNIPPLPFKTAGKLLFPAGKFTGVFSALELHFLKKSAQLYGFDFNKAVQLEKGYIYNKKPLFKEYVSAFYEMKKNGKGIEKMAAKLFLNSLYGKFGEGRRKKSYVMNPNLATIEKELQSSIKNDGINGDIKTIAYLEIPELNIWSLSVDKLPKHTSVPIAAHVTAAARVTLLNYIYDAEEKGAVVMYCDTDSIFVNRPIWSNSKELGGLKLEGAYKESIIMAPKMYALIDPMTLKEFNKYAKKEGINLLTEKDYDVKEKVKAKGFRQLTSEEFIDLLKGGKIKIEQGIGQFRSVLLETKRLLAGQKSKISRPLSVWALEIDKGLQSDYTKRIVNMDNSTSPLMVTDEMAIASWKEGVFKELREMLTTEE